MKLRKWVRVGIYILILITLCYSISSLFYKKEVVIKEGKNYTCYGSKLFQVCSGEDYDL